MRAKVKMSLLVLGVVICAGLFPGFAVAAEPVEIGVILSLTGPIGPHGQDALHASQLAVEEINKAGGVLGRPMKLIVEDTKSRPKSAVEAAHKLADVNKISVCLGGWSSGIALPTKVFRQVATKGSICMACRPMT